MENTNFRSKYNHRFSIPRNALDMHSSQGKEVVAIAGVSNDHDICVHTLPTGFYLK